MIVTFSQKEFKVRPSKINVEDSGPKAKSQCPMQNFYFIKVLQKPMWHNFFCHIKPL